MGNAPASMMPMLPATSSARYWSSASAMIGSKPQLPNTVENTPVKCSMMLTANTSFQIASTIRQNQMNRRIITLGTNHSAAASATTNTTNGKRFSRIVPASKPDSGAFDGPAPASSPRTVVDVATNSVVVVSTPIGIARTPDITPSAMYRWSRLSNMARPTGTVKMIVAPAM